MAQAFTLTKMAYSLLLATDLFHFRQCIGSFDCRNYRCRKNDAYSRREGRVSQFGVHYKFFIDILILDNIVCMYCDIDWVLSV